MRRRMPFLLVGATTLVWACASAPPAASEPTPAPALTGAAEPDRAAEVEPAATDDKANAPEETNAMASTGPDGTEATASEDPPAKGAATVEALTPLGPKVHEVTVGTQLTFSFASHGSVGKGGDYSIGDETVVRFVRRDLTYLHPERMGHGMTGGDAASAVFVFEAVKPGKTTVETRKTYRGDVTESTIHEITVK